MYTGKSFREVAIMWREAKRPIVKHSTMCAYNLTLQTHLLPRFGNMTSIGEADVQRFALEKLKSGLAKKTVRDMVDTLIPSLGGEEDKKLLDIRMFEEPTKRAAYMRQKKDAEERGVSNCPLCAAGENANKTRIYKYTEMDADHVTAWSKGGATTAENCEMLCKTHNRAKGNR